MKNLTPVKFAATILICILFFSSCKRINESTQIGGDLIPSVDNVNTFETWLAADSSRYVYQADSTLFFYNDYAALGKLNDPVFGTTTANIYFNLSLPFYGPYPFADRNSVKIDSVVLSLSYQGSYGDTTAASVNTVSVHEIAASADFRTDTLYRISGNDFPVGPELGRRNYTTPAIRDSISLIRRDTFKTANVIRIRLSNQIGQRLSSLDSASYATDSAFRQAFKGIAVLTEGSSGNGVLSYLNLADAAKTNLTIYYRANINGVTDSASAVQLTHSRNGQANIIKRQPAGEYANFAGQGKSPDGKLYIQSTPGSSVYFKIPALDTLSNRVIHRAELIVSKIPSALDHVFIPPGRLYLETLSPRGDTSYLFHNDLPVGSSGGVDFTPFGGNLRSDNTFRFTITRHVQMIVSDRQRNLSFKLSAPVRTTNYIPGFSTPLSVSVNQAPAWGRVVVGGGDYVNPSQRMKLRIIYSNL